ncbi:hypothetical protein [Streptomyces sp. NPDC057580]|uniref:hypothetical protein n=1 Tax=Streptomyces sp. NPDC057580 TaxID=3346173 RepID=UPI0036909D94
MLAPATPARIMRSLRSPEARAEDERLDAVSERERPVLDLIEDGLTNREIGKRFYLPEKQEALPVGGDRQEPHRRAASKLSVERRVQATAIAARFTSRRAGSH